MNASQGHKKPICSCLVLILKACIKPLFIKSWKDLLVNKKQSAFWKWYSLLHNNVLLMSKILPPNVINIFWLFVYLFYVRPSDTAIYSSFHMSLGVLSMTHIRPLSKLLTCLHTVYISSYPNFCISVYIFCSTLSMRPIVSTTFQVQTSIKMFTSNRSTFK